MNHRTTGKMAINKKERLAAIFIGCVALTLIQSLPYFRGPLADASGALRHFVMALISYSIGFLLVNVIKWIVKKLEANSGGRGSGKKKEQTPLK